jgi:Protein of unknown function (DUF3572)
VQRELAETIGLRALAWLAGNQELLEVFQGATGVSADDMKTRAQEPDFLGSVLEFVMMDDAWVVEFCDATGLGYDAPMRARQVLPGGAQINWT